MHNIRNTAMILLALCVSWGARAVVKPPANFHREFVIGASFHNSVSLPLVLMEILCKTDALSER